MDPSTADTSQLSSLLGGSSSGGGLFSFDSLLQSIMPFIIITTILTVVLTVAYVMSVVQRWRVNHAIIEIRDMIRDMKAASEPKVLQLVAVADSVIEPVVEVAPELTQTDEPTTQK